VGLALGQALDEALGPREGIVRMADATVPLDEALAAVAVDLSGRGYAAVDVAWTDSRIGELPADLVGHLLWSLASEGKLTLKPGEKETLLLVQRFAAKMNESFEEFLMNAVTSYEKDPAKAKHRVDEILNELKTETSSPAVPASSLPGTVASPVIPAKAGIQER
jgi:hypothetical protein